jgi:hypothetical protein
MKFAYIITCNGHISSLAFKKFEDAEKWILNRSDSPKHYSGWVYLAGANAYRIHEVTVE